MKTIHWLFILILLGGCKDKYNAPVHIPATGYLVEEGFINVGNGPTNIKLSRATGLDSPYVLPEYNAQVSVESENGSSYPLTEQGNGNYSINQVPVDFSQKYRLKINSASGKEYQSDLSVAKITPEIDSLSWKAVSDGVWIYVSTHDPQNKTVYYEWQYDETWQYESAYISAFEYIHDSIVLRPQSDQIYRCWTSHSSTTISIASSVKLNTDVIFETPLTLVPFSSTDKLSSKYSILIKQFALTKEWYEWLQTVRKNTEQLGSIFDAQPSEIRGNIHCVTDPGELVIGFVGCTTETQKRIFISKSEIPQAQVFSAYRNCQLDTIPNDPIVLAQYYGNNNNIPVIYYTVMGFIRGVIGSDAGCVDCRARGGVTTKPDFWQ